MRAPKIQTKTLRKVLDHYQKMWDDGDGVYSEEGYKLLEYFEKAVEKLEHMEPLYNYFLSYQKELEKK